MDIPIIGEHRIEQRKIELCRSFSYKLNLQNHGGPAYESADFFASRKMECFAEDAGWVSQQIFEECVAEVRAAVAAFIDEMRRKIQARRVHPAAATNSRAFEKWKDEQADEADRRADAAAAHLEKKEEETV